jgi:TRAP-type transport system periplasmic protein
MSAITLKFGGYQKPASIHNRAAARFGAILKAQLGARIAFELIGDVLAIGRGSGDLLPMVERGELSCCYISTVRFTRWVPEFKLLELPFVVKSRPSIIRALDGDLGTYLKRRVREATPFRVLGFWAFGISPTVCGRSAPQRIAEDCAYARR